jgi:hypothetical protein
MFRREVRTTSLASLTREIQSRRELVHDAMERALANVQSEPSAPGNRIYRVFASFQGDVGGEEAYYMGR